MKILNIKFDTPLDRPNEIRILKWKFLLLDHGFISKLSRILYSSHSGIYALLILMMSMFLFSCEDQLLDPEYDNLSEMTSAEKLKFFGVTDLSQLKPGYTYTWIDTLDREEAKVVRQNLISTRSSYDCGINVMVSLSQSTDTVTVNVYEANTSVKVHGPVIMTDGDDFDMEINGSKDYDFEVIPFDINMDRTFASLIVNPDWGSKWVFGFPNYGPILIEDYHFDCPEPTDGTCDAAVAVYQLSGTAETYTLKIIPDVGDSFLKHNIPGDGSANIKYLIDQDRTYAFEITTKNGSSSESFTVQIIRPDNVAYNKTFYGADMSARPSPFLLVFDQFDYFRCP